MKQCSQCKMDKSSEEFGKRTNGAYGKMGVCRMCANAYQRGRPRQKSREAVAKYRNKHRARFLIRYARDRAQEKNWAFDLDAHRKEIQARIDAGVCELSGVKLDLNGSRAFNSPSIDRIDPKRGYTYDNIRILCFAMNSALGDWGEENLHAVLVSWLRKRQGERVTDAGRRLAQAAD